MLQLLVQVLYIFLTTAAADWLARRWVNPLPNRRQRLLSAGVLWVAFSVLLVVGLWLILFILGTLEAKDDTPFGSTGLTIAGLLFYTVVGSTFNVFIAGVVIFLYAVKGKTKRVP